MVIHRRYQDKPERRLKIVTIGGGTGSFVVLSGLKKYPVEISAIVNMTDSGGSSGKLRDELGVLPPGDARQCLVALARADTLMRELFNYRFSSGELAGHSFGNIFISALEKNTGSFDRAISRAGDILRIRGKVVPVTTQKAQLHLILNNGEALNCEDKISSSVNIRQVGISKIFLKPKAKANPQAVQAIMEADAIVIGPGNLYSSLIPNFLVDGIKEAVRDSGAIKIFNVNLMTQKGHTDGFSVFDFAGEIENYLGRNALDFVIYNTKTPPKLFLENYAGQGELVMASSGKQESGKYKIVGADLLSRRIYKQGKADKLQRTLVRHDPDKLAKIILETLNYD